MEFVNRLYFPAAGSRSTAGGRSHIRHNSLEAKRVRREVAWRAYHLRVVDGRSIRDIAGGLNVSKSNVQRWLQGVPRVKQDQLSRRQDQFDAAFVNLAAEWYG